VAPDGPQVVRVGSLATVWRGARGRCGRCGSRGALVGFFRLRERCPRCGYRFAREEGFFTGVYLVNFSVTIGILWLLVMGYTLWRAAGDRDSGITAVLVVGVALAVILPIVLYPLALTTWAAIDLVLRPLEPDEEAEAAVWAAESIADGGDAPQAS
jgi:uncharacterized protein (DUF983 family)